MKKTAYLLSFFIVFSVIVDADLPNKEQNRQQDRYQFMSTDELLEKRANASTQKERDELLDELRNRQMTMRKDQFEKMMNREFSGQNRRFETPYRDGMEKVQSDRMRNYGSGQMGGRGGGRGR